MKEVKFYMKSGTKVDFTMDENTATTTVKNFAKATKKNMTFEVGDPHETVVINPQEVQFIHIQEVSEDE